MCVPELLGYHSIWSIGLFTHFSVRLLCNFVQVLVDQVKNVVNKFLGILLAIPTEPTDFSAQCPLQVNWSTSAAAATPHFLHKPSIGCG